MKIDKPKSLAELMKLLAQAQSEGAEVKFVNAETGEEGVPPELARMLEAAGGDCPACGEDHKQAVPPTPELAHALLDIVAVHQSPPQFKPGDFVRFRKEIGYVKRPRNLHVIVENVSPPLKAPVSDETFSSPFGYRSYNVIVAVETGAGIARYYADSRELELFPDADKLITKSS